MPEVTALYLFEGRRRWADVDDSVGVGKIGFTKSLTIELTDLLLCKSQYRERGW